MSTSKQEAAAKREAQEQRKQEMLREQREAEQMRERAAFLESENARLSQEATIWKNAQTAAVSVLDPSICIALHHKQPITLAFSLPTLHSIRGDVPERPFVAERDSRGDGRSS